MPSTARRTTPPCPTSWMPASGTLTPVSATKASSSWSKAEGSTTADMPTTPRPASVKSTTSRRPSMSCSPSRRCTRTRRSSSSPPTTRPEASNSAPDSMRCTPTGWRRRRCRWTPSTRASAKASTLPALPAARDMAAASARRARAAVPRAGPSRAPEAALSSRRILRRHGTR